MGVILNSDDFLVDQVLDIIIIFVMGIILLFFFGTMLHYPKTFLITYSLYIMVLLVSMLSYINMYCSVNTEHKNKVNIINFMGIYTICLNILLATVVSSGIV